MITLRIRSPNGPSSCSLEDTATLQDLRNKIAELTSIVPAEQDLRTGFPPKPFATDTSPETSLSSLGIRSGDSIIVAQSAAQNPKSSSSSTAPPPPVVNSPVPSPAPSLPRQPVASSGASSSSPQFVEVDGGFLVLRVVPDDNSCLFTAVSLVFNPSSPPNPSSLREIVADAIRADPVTYSEVMLGRPPKDYIETILSPKSWGGAIELSIFSTHFQSEIWSIDVQTGRTDKFGEGNGFQNCVFIVYSGIHYDALTFSFAPPSSAPFPPDLSFDTTIFPLPVEPTTLSAATQLVGVLRKNHSYTDTATFSLRCEVCREAIVGEKEARQHASQTGHQRFGEYDD
ncbi:ubiquitin-specific protease OTU1 [Sporobolomyces salmoneus]|uniref:ubiquitin-specific protease OTU1 n=1 Tax=Sporobolomyces salmoneus TaxID=183962 RepID=UPI003179266A